MEIGPLRRRSGVLARPIVHGANPDGVILLDTVSGRCFEANRMGAALWAAIDGRRSLVEVCESVTVGDRQREDAQAFLEDLLAEGLVEAGARAVTSK